MGAKLYEVVYIDKFVRQAEADAVRRRFRRRFCLNSQTLARLGSGKPVILKKNISFKMAEELKLTVEAIGGVCWVQQVPQTGTRHERRCLRRRVLPDRRGSVRFDSVISDRRINPGRRSSDWV